MSARGRQFFDDWVQGRLSGFNPPYLQNTTWDNERYLIAEAKQVGIEELEIRSEVGGNTYRAVYDAMMKALEPNANRT